MLLQIICIKYSTNGHLPSTYKELTMNKESPYSPPNSDVAINTVEGSVLASRWKRLAAMLINIAILLLPIFLAGLVSGYNDLSLMTNNSNDAMSLIMLGVFYIVIIIINMMLIIKKSATVGKVLMKIKIVRSSGEKCSPSRIIGLRIIINGLISMIPILGPVYSIIDPLLIFNERKQCIHDFLADTIVIDA